VVDLSGAARQSAGVKRRSSDLRGWTAPLSLALSVLGLSGCAALANLNLPLDGVAAAVKLIPPSIAYEGAELVQSPSRGQLASYYCPEVISLPFNGAPLACRGFFGVRPTPPEMAIAFDLRFKVSNPNQIPLPLASVLTAVTVFPSATNQSLGAVCTQLCPAGQAGCVGGDNPSACETSNHDIRSLSDFGNAAANLLLSDGIAMALGQKPTFVGPKVSSASELTVTVRFSFGLEPLLRVMRQLAVQSADELKAGHTPAFTIPFQLQGTVWFDTGSLGRIATGYGPVAGIWALPTEGLVPR
jgi:hypothetical protein